MVLVFVFIWVIVDLKIMIRTVVIAFMEAKDYSDYTMVYFMKMMIIIILVVVLSFQMVELPVYFQIQISMVSPKLIIVVITTASVSNSFVLASSCLNSEFIP